jgi:hypothetical protein
MKKAMMLTLSAMTMITAMSNARAAMPNPHGEQRIPASIEWPLEKRRESDSLNIRPPVNV